MALIDITPKMTSNTTPVNYEVKASSEYDASFSAYKAFDGKTIATNGNDGNWASANTTLPQWIQIKFPTKTKCDCLSWIGRSKNATTSPKKCTVLGSDDGVNFVTIELISQIEHNDIDGFIYVFKDTMYYAYYRVQIDVAGTATYLSIDEIYLYIDDSKNVSHTNAFHAQTLPMNTTQKILAKTNDSREGLLGMANDQENYGDLYVVGRDGKSHLTKSGMKSEVIFEGSANAIGEYSLTSSIEKFKYLYIQGFGYNISSGFISTMIDTKAIDYNTPRLFPMYFYSPREIIFGFPNDTTVRLDSITLGTAQSIGIKKIIGIY